MSDQKDLAHARGLINDMRDEIKTLRAEISRLSDSGAEGLTAEKLDEIGKREQFDDVAKWLRQQVRLLESLGSLPSEQVCYDAGCIYEHPHPKHDPPVEHPAAAALAQIATLVRDTPLYIFEDDSAAEDFRNEIAAILALTQSPRGEE
jgi:hypothetical protein